MTCGLCELDRCSSDPQYISQSESLSLRQALVWLREPAPTHPGSRGGAAHVSLLELDSRRE